MTLVEVAEPPARYRCITGCGFCCMFESEYHDFENPPEYIKVHLDRDGNIENTNGGCYFLNRDDLRCDIYNERPIMCRLYPYGVHISTRIQITVDLSCPGVEIISRAEDVPVEEILSFFPEGYLERKLIEGRMIWLEYARKANMEMPIGLSKPAEEAIELVEEDVSRGEYRYIPKRQEYPSDVDEARLYYFHGKRYVLISMGRRFLWREIDPHGRWKDITDFTVEDAYAAMSYDIDMIKMYASWLRSRDAFTGFALFTYLHGSFYEHYIDLMRATLEKLMWESGAINILMSNFMVDYNPMWEAIRFLDHEIFTLPTAGLWA